MQPDPLPRRSRVPLLLLGAALLLGHGLWALAQVESAPQEKAAVPDKAALDRGEAFVRKLFKEKYDRAKTDAVVAAALANALLEEGKATTDDRALQFAALNQAREVAARAGHIALALDALAELTKRYDVNGVALKSATLELAADQVATADAAMTLIEAAFVCLDEAVAADHYAPAAAAVAAAERALPKVKDGQLPLAGRLKKRAAEVEGARKEFERLTPFVDRLKKDKDDAEANLEVGRYLVIVKGDFNKGLPLLARGKDAALKDLAARDLAGAKDVKQQVALGDAWDQLAGDQKTLSQRQLQRRAFYWYDKALPNLAGITRSRVAQRHEDLARQFEEELARQMGVLVNSVGIRLVPIPAGKFLMGAPNGENGSRADEMPQHEVEITKPFYLGAFEVTQAQYEKVTGANPSQHNNHMGMDTKDWPVEKVTWQDAKNFCDKLSSLPAEKQAGRVYRLPTEAEWEYACRAGGKAPYQTGADLTGKDANIALANLARPTKVGSYRPNAWGLYDMHGNVWEWCEDWFDANYYSQSPKQDPPGPANGTSRIHHGGSFLSSPVECRSAYRISNSPTSSYHDNGFRVVCVIKR